MNFHLFVYLSTFYACCDMFDAYVFIKIIRFLSKIPNQKRYIVSELFTHQMYQINILTNVILTQISQVIKCLIHTTTNLTSNFVNKIKWLV